MAKKQLFGVFAPILGEEKNFPTILLDKTVQVDNRDIVRKYGEVHRRKMREMDMLTGSTVDINSAAGQKVLSIASTTVFVAGKRVVINSGGVREEYGVVASVSSGVSITLVDNLTYAHTAAQADEVQVSTQTPDTFPILHYHTFIKRSTGMQYELCFTKAHIYLWNTTDDGWDLVFTCQSDCTEWDTVTYNNMVMATNNVDMVLVWDTIGYFVPLQNTTPTVITAASKEDPCHITAVAHDLTTGDRVYIKNVGGMTEINNLQFVVTVDSVDIFSLDGVDSTEYTTYTSGGTVVEFQGIEYAASTFLTKAKYVSTFENFLILGYTTEDSVLYPQRERWNAIGDETAWKTGDAGSKETEGSDVIAGFKVYSGMFVIFKERTRIIQSLLATAEVWKWVVLSGAIGNLSNHSIVEDPDGRVYWLANDFSIREMGLGEISQGIDPIVKLIEPSSAHLVCGAYIEETGEIWWCIPYNNTLNNKVITLKIVDGIVKEWGELNLAISAFGSYEEE